MFSELNTETMAIQPCEMLSVSEADFQSLHDDKTCKSLLKKHLTREVFDELKDKKTRMGAGLLDVIKSGLDNHDSGIGIYAADAECYTTFAPLFNAVIEDYHGGFNPDRHVHPPTDFGNLSDFVNVDPEGKYVVSTRVRCGRSIAEFPMNPCMTEQNYRDMQSKVASVFQNVFNKDTNEASKEAGNEGIMTEFKGTFYPLEEMSKETEERLIKEHFLFKNGDRFLESAQALNFWPVGRGIYLNESKTFLVWVGEEDHLRIISMQQGGDLGAVYKRMVAGVQALEKAVPFSRDEKLGFLTFCPTNCGTTIRASVHIKLPLLSKDLTMFEAVAKAFNLQVRGSAGEHSEAVGGIYDVSNNRRLGLTEAQAVHEMQKGIQALIKIEKSLEAAQARASK